MDELLQRWQNLPASIDPVLISVGSFQLRYYSLMYLAAFLCTYLLVMYRLRTERYGYSKETIQDFFIWAIVGLLVGARLGYVLFYDVSYFAVRPLEIVLPFTWSGGFRFTGISGLSYHGGALGVFLATFFFCRRRKVRFFRFMDLIVSAVPLGYTFGRVGNFINGELYGRVTTVPWGMYFPADVTKSLRHPSQLYEAFFEGLLLFALLWSVRKRDWKEGSILALYVAGYGTVRFFIEFFREADAHLGLLFGFLTMGQVLCLVMVAGATVWILICKRQKT
ncbi:MAG: prolipoprotein diacylglyceryl transferase [Syntrophales bacterium]|jgi:phosphatidylglycerol:prolipoprotein diacylglycerol transferase|nr:prolipoprotein diacylglyceryl transferase [Syntrophales bacterium]MCK9527184.1 prolipoprotein diacylglyceryl transferase [Syntrophales bacterium]MDX9921692.1 prolipoprotein diacylglyceryl transferase [Syntrophales bacterium]